MVITSQSEEHRRHVVGEKKENNKGKKIEERSGGQES
jgi:hypothetical protein